MAENTSGSANFKDELQRPIRNRPQAFGMGKFGVGIFSNKDSTRYAWTRVKATLAVLGMLAGISAAVLAADTYTSGLQLRKPAVDVEDTTTSWGEKVNTNYDTLDAAICDKRVGCTITGNLVVSGTMTATGGSSTTVTAAFAGNGTTVSPLAINSSSITAQGNSFNAASKLLQLDSSGYVPLAQLDAIASGDLADSAVTTAKLASDAVTSTKILSAAVTTPKLATDAVLTANLITGSVTTPKLATDAATTEKLATDSVSAPKILSASVTTSKLASDAVTAAKILSGAITTAKLATDSVIGSSILDGTISVGKLGFSVGSGDVTQAAGGAFGAAAAVSFNHEDVITSSHPCRVVQSTRTVNIPTTSTTQTTLIAAFAGSTITSSGWNTSTFPRFNLYIYLDKTSTGRAGCSPLIDGVLHDANGVGSASQPAWGTYENGGSDALVIGGSFTAPVNLSAGSHSFSLACANFSGAGTINLYGSGAQGSNWFTVSEVSCKD